MSNTKTIGTVEANVLQTLTNDARKPQSERTVKRRLANNHVRAEIMNFTDVFKYVRKEYFNLPNRVYQKHINESDIFIKSLLLEYCSENLAEKSKENFYIDRLSLLLTDIPSLKCFMTSKQLETFGQKSWSFTQIMDIIVKAITMNVKNYNACLSMREKVLNLGQTETK